MSVIVGIDLGTTYSVIATVSEAGQAEVIPNSEGSPTTPSVVLFDNEVAVVGAVAKEALSTDPENVVQLIKRHMGSQWTFERDGVAYRPQHVSTLILRKLIQDASVLVGPISQAVITVPAYFNDAMRLATRRAGELAGLDVLGLLSEPTAAAIAFGYDHRSECMTVMVVDLGGGTFDVTVMYLDGGSLVVRATGGDPYLGGANFDKAIFDYCVQSFTDATGLNVTDPDALSLEEFAQVSQEWLVRANRAKLDLTSRAKTVIALQAAGRSLRVELTRAAFESLIAVLLDEMVEKAADVIRAAGLTPQQIDDVIAVGGSTRVPVVRQRMAQLVGRPLDTRVRPDEAVAQGAALFAAQRRLEEGGALVLSDTARQYLEAFSVADVAAHSVGVLVYDRPRAEGGRPLNSIVLARNTALPFEGSRTFYTATPGETTVTIPVLEGEEEDADLCTRIGEVVVAGLPPNRPALQPVTVTMRYNRDAILEVVASDDNSGQQTSAQISRAAESSTSDAAADTSVRVMKVE